MASPIRDPDGSRYSPGWATAPATSTTRSPAASPDPAGDGASDADRSTAAAAKGAAPSRPTSGAERSGGTTATMARTPAPEPTPMTSHGTALAGGPSSAAAAGSAVSRTRHGAPEGSTGRRLPGGHRRRARIGNARPAGGTSSGMGVRAPR